MTGLFAMISGRRSTPQIAVEAAVELKIKANPRGIKMGYFHWPYNFDPVWLEACDGLEPIARAKEDDGA